MEKIANEIRDFIVREFEVEQDEEFTDDVNLFDYGYIDSLDATKIIMFLEEHFKIEISQKDLILYPMNSISELTEVVFKKVEA